MTGVQTCALPICFPVTIIGMSILNNNGTNVLFSNSRSFSGNNDLFTIVTDNKTSFQCHEMDAEVVTPNITATSQQLNLGLQNGNENNQNQTGLIISNTTFRNLCVCSEINEIVTTAPACSGTSVLFWHPNLIDTCQVSQGCSHGTCFIKNKNTFFQCKFKR